MAQRQLLIPGPVVKKSNALARASWSVKSVYEPRLVALVASRVRVDDQDFQYYEIPLSELLGGAVDGRTRQLVSEVVEGLLGRILTLPRPNGWAKCNVFSWCEYDSKAGCIRARFDPGLKEHYLGLQSHFTQYSLMEFLLLPSTYSQRLFEVLKSWSGLPESVIDLVDLFGMLDVPKSMQRYPDFRRYVLEKAHKDITSQTGLRYQWEPIKQGRAVAAIRFTFGARSAQSSEKNSQAQRSRDNTLLKKAVVCFKSGSCSPKSNKQCEICKRLVRS
jgi:Initiator Replication protein